MLPNEWKSLIAGDRKAQTPTIKSAKALALTALDIFTKPGMLEEIKENFKKDLEEATKAWWPLIHTSMLYIPDYKCYSPVTPYAVVS